MSFLAAVSDTSNLNPNMIGLLPSAITHAKKAPRNQFNTGDEKFGARNYFCAI
jgi:hypothetical protein